MKLINKLWIVPVIALVTACKRQKVDRVLIYDDAERVEWLNGPVKQVFVGKDSLLTHDFSRVDFDEKGNMIRSETNYVNVSTGDNGVKDSSVINSKVTYTAVYNGNGMRRCVLGTYTDHWRRTSDTTTTTVLKFEFDKSGNLTHRDTPSDTLGSGDFYQYNKKGELIAYKHIFGTLAEPDSYKYKYDRNHRLIESNLYEGEEFLIKNGFKYLSFDSHQNWTKVVITEESHSSLMSFWAMPDTITRKITYY